MATKADSVHSLARQYAFSGISVIPLLTDGSKSPASHLLPKVCNISSRKQSGSWAPYQDRIAEPSEINEWFGGSVDVGIGMVAGIVSGGLEIFDFDDGSLFPPWSKLVKPIVERLPVVETPSGGWHVLFRCDEIGGNCKIAKDPAKADKPTLIETRGEGGYVVAEGSPCNTHATGLPYAQYSGPALPEIPRITPAERRQLWAAARTFDKQPARVRERLVTKYSGQLSKSHSQGMHPAALEFCRRTTWASILEPHGWTTQDGVVWSRPGKSDWVKSAQVFTAKDGQEVLVVWSGNAGALAPESGDNRTWNKFSAWVALEHGGNRSKAIEEAGKWRH